MWIVLFLFAKTLLEHWHWLPSYENGGVDAYLRLQSPILSQDVKMVVIGDADKARLYDKDDYISPAGLTRLLDAISQGKPRVIGVVLNTSAPKFHTIQPSKEWPPVVWTRTAANAPDHNNAWRAAWHVFNPFSKEEDTFMPGGVLGRNDPSLLSGLDILPIDTDGIHRRYKRWFAVDTPTKTEASFPWAVVSAFRKHKDYQQTEHVQKGETASAKPRDAELTLTVRFSKASDEPIPHQKRSINFFQTISVQEALELGKKWRQNPAPPSNGVFYDKIVLLGRGDELATRYPTPTGQVSSMELSALCVEAEIRQGISRFPNQWWTLLVQGVLALLLTFVKPITENKLKQIALISVPLLAALLLSTFLFHTPILWIYFLPVLLAGFIERLHEQASELYKSTSERKNHEVRFIRRVAEIAMARFRQRRSKASEQQRENPDK